MSRRAGSVAGRWIGIIVGLDGAWLRRSFSPPGFALRTRRGAFLAGADAQPLDAARIGIEHFDFKIAGPGNDFAAHRQPSDMGHEIAAQRLDFLAGFAGDEILADHGADVVEAGARVGDEGVIRLPHDRWWIVAVVLVIDLAD